MICKEAMLLISGHLDQVNTEEEELQLQAHLKDCAACRELLALLRGQDAAIGAMTQEAPPSLCGNVMQAIRQDMAAKKRQRRAWRSAAVAAALVAVIGIGSLALPKKAGPAAPADAAVPMTVSEDSVQAQPIALQAPEARTYSVAEDSCFSLALEIAEARGADVVWLEELPAELSGNAECETVAEGWLLYTLPAADTAAQLSEQYQAELSQPTERAANCTVSYALIKAS